LLKNRIQYFEMLGRYLLGLLQNNLLFGRKQSELSKKQNKIES